MAGARRPSRRATTTTSGKGSKKSSTSHRGGGGAKAASTSAAGSGARAPAVAMMPLGDYEGYARTRTRTRRRRRARDRNTTRMVLRVLTTRVSRAGKSEDRRDGARKVDGRQRRCVLNLNSRAPRHRSRIIRRRRRARDAMRTRELTTMHRIRSRA